MTDLTRLDLTDVELYRDGYPHGAFAQLRRESPVWWQSIPAHVTGCADAGFWVLSRYDDIRTANRDTELFSALDELLRVRWALREATLVLTVRAMVCASRGASYKGFA